jgi:hypothetical protein
MQAKAQGILDHFGFNAISPQTAGTSFSVTITALDSSGDTVTSYTGTPSLSDLSGTISPTSTSAFMGGVWTGSVTVTLAGPDYITATDGAIAGTSTTFTVNPIINASAGANGAINPTGSVVVNFGDNQSFTITPNSGYYIASITTDAGSVAVTSPSGQTVSFINVQADHTITATYAPKNYTLTIHTIGQGSVTPGNGTYLYDTIVSLQAISAEGYSFGGWSNGVTGSTISLTMNADQIVTANFTQNPQPTTTPTPTQTATTTTTPTTMPTPTPTSTASPTIALATMGQYLPVIAAAIILGAVIIGLVVHRRRPAKIIILS